MIVVNFIGEALDQLGHEFDQKSRFSDFLFFSKRSLN